MPRNCFNIVSFTLLIMNRCTCMWFRLETKLNNSDIRKTSWVNLIIILDRQYKSRNCFNNVRFTLLIMNRGTWNWFRLEKILNINDIEKTSWVDILIIWIDKTSLETVLIMQHLPYWLWTKVYEIDSG